MTKRDEYSFRICAGFCIFCSLNILSPKNGLYKLRVCKYAVMQFVNKQHKKIIFIKLTTH